MPSISIVAILVPPEPPVPINRHLLGGERKGWMPRGVGGTSSSSSSTKTAGDVPSCPCGLSAHPPPLSGPPSPPLQTPPLSYLLNTPRLLCPVPWEGFTAPSLVQQQQQLKRNPLEPSQNSSQPTNQPTNLPSTSS